MSARDENLFSLVPGRLKEERQRLGLSQHAVAGLCGVSREIWGKYERGQTVPGGEVLFSFANAGADIAYIMTGMRVSSLATQEPHQARPAEPSGAVVGEVRESTVVPPEGLVRKREAIKAMVDQVDDEAKLGAIQANLEDIERVKRLERDYAKIVAELHGRAA